MIALKFFYNITRMQRNVDNDLNVERNLKKINLLYKHKRTLHTMFGIKVSGTNIHTTIQHRD